MPKREKDFDSLDYQIIQALHADGRVAASEIARLTQSNERTIRKRIDRLLRQGVVRLGAILNPEAFGYITAADVFLEIDPAQEQKVTRGLMEMPEVTDVAYGQGTHDISIEARFEDNEALREFIGHPLPRMRGVKVTRYALVPRILRNIDEWMPPREDFGLEES